MSFRSTIRGWWASGGNSGAAVAEPDFIERGQGRGSPSGAQSYPNTVAPPPIATSVKPVPQDVGLGMPPGSGARLQGPMTVDGRELGAPGTPNLAGFIEDLGEYRADLQGLDGVRYFEKMRRRCPVVAAVEAAVTLPVAQAEWRVEPPEDDKSPLGKEVAELVQDNLMGGLELTDEEGNKHSQTFESVLRNALLCAALGCSGSEDIWEIDRGAGSRPAIRLARIAPRLPITFYQFITAPNGETLRTLVQFGFRRDTVDLFPVPANKITLHSFNKEGGYFYGRSMLRPAVAPEYFRERMIVIDAIGGERNRLATPVIRQGPNASPDDVAKSWMWAQNLSTNERAALSLPHQWDFAWTGITGRAIELTGSLRYYDEQIAESGLAGFLSLGKTATGSRALGDVKMNFFLLALNGLANMIAQNYTSTTIRRLVMYNYPEARTNPAEFPWPRLTHADITILNVMDLVDAIAKAGTATVGWLNPDEHGVQYILQRLGVPQGGKPIARWAPTNVRVMEESQGDLVVQPGEKEDTQGTASPKATARKPVIQPRPQEPGQEQETAEMAEAQPGAAVQLKPNRELKDFERKHDFAAHVKRADIAGRQVARLLRQAKAGIVADVARGAAHVDMTTLPQIAPAFDRSLAQRVKGVLGRARGFGRDQVYAERRKATGRHRGIPAKASLAMADAPKKSGEFYAQATVSDYLNELGKRVKARVIDLAKDLTEPANIESQAVSDVMAAPDGWIDRLGDEAGRNAVAGGRMDGLGELAPEIESYVRSEVMDQGTAACAEAGGGCWEGDGHEWKTFDDIDWQPGDDCAGGDACRGQVIPIFEDEGTVTLE